MRILLDATGGDGAPAVNLEGALEALRTYPDVELTLLGPEETIRKAMEPAGWTDADRARAAVLDAPEIITPDEHPAMALRRKKRSPFVVGMSMLRAGEADAFVSAGSTVAVMAGAMFVVRCSRGIARPALGAVLPVPGRPMLLIDAGANVDCKPAWLAQFALMGSVYMKEVLGVADPEVGLLNIGAEAAKGNALSQEAYALLSREQPFRFAGNVEARDALAGVCDVLVTDGFAGNVLLKNTEGVAALLFGILKKEMLGSVRGKAAALLAKDCFRGVKKSFDSTEVGGAPLLGVGGAVIKAHGSSNGHAIFCAIRQARTMAEQDVTGKIREGLTKLQTEPDAGETSPQASE